MKLLTIRLAIFSFSVLTTVFFLISLFFIKYHEEDLDAFLYIGSRLWVGELLYFHDYETKLPTLQYIFSLASAFGGIGAWRIITMLISLTLGFYGSRLLAKEFIRAGFNSLSLSQASLLCLTFFMLLLYSLPGSESAHIDIIAASAAYVSLGFTLSIGNTFTRNKLFLSSLFLALAASIRPNYIYILFAFLPIYFLQCNGGILSISKSSLISSTKLALLYVLLQLTVFGLTICLLFLPYFLSEHGISVLREGLSALASFSDGVSLKKLISSQFHRRTVTFYLSLYGTVGILLWYLKHNYFIKNSFLAKCFMFPVFCVVLINLSFLRNHYNLNYVIMFVPYVVPIFFLIFNFWVSHRCSGKGLVYKMKRSMRIMSYFVCFVILITPVAQLVSYGRQFFKNRFEFNFQINDRKINYVLLNYLAKDMKSFLTDEPIYHMLLKESRIGDGSPAMLSEVMSGKKLGPISNIYLYSEEVHNTPCLSLVRSNKELIIFNKKSVYNEKIHKCLNVEGTSYKKILIDKLDGYIIYSRF